MVELIPGTALPVYAPQASEQPEGRGAVQIREGRGPTSLFERLSARDDVSPAELAMIDAAIRGFDRRPKTLDNIFATTARVTDTTTGNVVIPLFTVPGGTEGHVTFVVADVPGSATITPSAPLANASIWTFLAAAGASTGASASTADTLRAGMVAFAPTAAAGPVLPGAWTFNDTNAPVLQSGDELFYVMHGGSIAAALGITVQVTYRINLYTNMT
jgi:hypothetical protein